MNEAPVHYGWQGVKSLTRVPHDLGRRNRLSRPMPTEHWRGALRSLAEAGDPGARKPPQPETSKRATLIAPGDHRDAHALRRFGFFLTF